MMLRDYALKSLMIAIPDIPYSSCVLESVVGPRNSSKLIRTWIRLECLQFDIWSVTEKYSSLLSVH